MNDSLTFFFPLADTLFQVVQESAYVDSFTRFSEMHAVDITPIPRTINSFFSDWNLIIFGVVLLIIVMSKQIAPLRTEQIFTTLYSNKNATLLSRDWSPISITGISFFMSQVLFVALFLQKTLMVFTGNFECFNDLSFYLKLCLILFVVIFIKYLIINFTGWIFKNKDVAVQNTNLLVSSLSIYMLLLLPLLLIIIYNPYKIFFIIAFIMWIVIWVIRLYKIFVGTTISAKLPLFYIFVYLCTLEIIPYWILVQDAVRYIVSKSV